MQHWRCGRGTEGYVRVGEMMQKGGIAVIWDSKNGFGCGGYGVVLRAVQSRYWIGGSIGGM